MVFLLLPLSWIYGLAIRLRNLLYDRGLLAARSLGVTTISVGNITTGGTGKTPLVALVARILADSGERVCILTRGYGRRNENERILVSDGAGLPVSADVGGDEPVELARRLGPKAIVIAQADRAAAAEWAKAKFSPTVFVLDDGFQHRRVRRDLDIVCVDATDPFGRGSMLPAGRLREPVGSLRRAGAIVVTRADLVDDTDAVAADVRSRGRSAPIFNAGTRIAEMVPVEKFLNESSRKKPVHPDSIFAFCGLGNPEVFFESLRRGAADARLAGVKRFPDHHAYTQKDVDDLAGEAEWSGAEALVTTAKDAVKLDGLRLPASMPLLVAIAEIELDDPRGFKDVVLSALS
ncbi:MAG: tetraacyldisaccharide 4'-kinase [Pyrinomonadaceae bacterium]